MFHADFSLLLSDEALNLSVDMSGRYESYDEPLCLSSLMKLQKTVDKLARSLEEKIPQGLAIRTSKLSNGRTTFPPTTPTPSPILLPTWPLAKTSWSPEDAEFPGSSENDVSPKDYLLLCVGFVTIWTSLTLLTLTWVRMNDLGYRTRSVSSRLEIYEKFG